MTTCVSDLPSNIQAQLDELDESWEGWVRRSPDTFEWELRTFASLTGPASDKHHEQLRGDGWDEVEFGC